MKRKTTITLTNWTFGIWWGTIGRRKRFGLDVGPLEIIWSESKKSSKK